MMTFENLQNLFAESFPNGNLFLDHNLNVNVCYRKGGFCHQYKPQADQSQYRCSIKTSILDTDDATQRVVTYYYNPRRHNENTALAVLLGLANYEELEYRFIRE